MTDTFDEGSMEDMARAGAKVNAAIIAGAPTSVGVAPAAKRAAAPKAAATLKPRPSSAAISEPDAAPVPAAAPAAPTKTRSEMVAADIVDLLRARNPLLWIVTREEARTEGYLVQAAAAAGYVPRTWDCGQGVAEIDGTISGIGGVSIDDTLAAIRKRAGEKADKDAEADERGAWIMRDLPAWLVGPIGMVTTRQMCNLARVLPGIARRRSQALIVVSPNGDVPPELAGHATVIEWPLPDREEIAKMLDRAIDSLPEFENKVDPDTKRAILDSATGQPIPDTTRPFRAMAAPGKIRDAAIDAAVGLLGNEAQACISKSIVKLRKVDPKTIASEKKRVIARERVLEWFDPIPGGLDAVGGLENLKAWLLERRLAYSPEARAYGLPSPKGCVLVGVPGCGKSLTAKATATALGVPLLKLDLGALKDKFVGGSEANMRKALSTIEAIGRCVVWLDEIEKSLSGATQGGADGGVSTDQLGALLQWMQERKGESFVFATANSVENLPPELLRKGRFDELFFVDLPNPTERLQVLAAALKEYGRKISDLDPRSLQMIVDRTDTFTGSEIAAIVPDALFLSFADGARQITAADLCAAALKVTPLAETAKERIAALRKWAETKARKASADYVAPTQAIASADGGRMIDIE